LNKSLENRSELQLNLTQKHSLIMIKRKMNG
jgi:hypothetical protein